MVEGELLIESFRAETFKTYVRKVFLCVFVDPLVVTGRSSTLFDSFHLTEGRVDYRQADPAI